MWWWRVNEEESWVMENSRECVMSEKEVWWWRVSEEESWRAEQTTWQCAMVENVLWC